MRRQSRGMVMGVALSALSLAALASCGGGGPPTEGTERGHCYANGTCNAGLSCLSTFCVHIESDAGADAGSGLDATTADSSGGAGTGAAGTGSAGGTGGAAGTSGASGAAGSVPFVPASHAPLPQVLSLGGSVLAAPKVRPIIYADDAHAADISAFLADLTRSPYWRTVTSEYGVGALTILPAIHVATAAPKTRNDNDLRDELANNTSGTNPVWGAADPGTIYLYVLPEGASVQADQAVCCTDFGGYHSDTTSGNATIPYAVACSCPGFFGTAIGPVDERTMALSHELVEAATDPFPASDPAFQIEDRSNLVWSATTGGEVADMCALNDDSAIIAEGSKYAVQRSWSNVAAQAGKNPCVPVYSTGPYFNSYPSLDTVNWDLIDASTRGVSVPFGSSKTIEVRLSSAAPTKAAWKVEVFDYDYFMQGTTPSLKLVLDKSQGSNGDVLHLTITPTATSPKLQGEAFFLVSSLGTPGAPDYQMNMMMGLVTN